MPSSVLRNKREMTKRGALAVPSYGPVLFRVISSDAISTNIEIGFDYSKAVTPDRAYYADYCDVIEDRFGFTLIFGKLVPGDKQLRTKIEITFPKDMFARQLWFSSRQFHEVVRTAAKNHFSPLGEVGETDKVQTFRSNNVFMGTWGEESVADFYYLSPKDTHVLAQGGRNYTPTLEPIVRVAMGTELMFEFLEKCRPFAEKVNVNLPVMEAEQS